MNIEVEILTVRHLINQNMDSLVSCVPPGFRFHPTDEELVGYYLKKKVAAQKIDLDVIRDVDLYRIEPWELQECCRIGCEEQTEWYFFSHKDKKYPTGTRTNRATMAGFWKATGRDKAVHDEKKRLIGMRKTLVFYKGRAPNGHKSDWIIHEYRLQTQQDPIAPPQEEGWVVCRAFKKRTSNIEITRNYMQEDHSNNYHPFINNISPAYPLESTGLSSQLQLLLHQQLNNSFQLLPQLEAPQNNFFPLSNSSFQCSSLSMIPHNPSLDKNNEEEAEEEQRICSAAATDWRELDKFVASQLSHEEDDGSDMAALLLLESNEGEEEEEEEETEQEGEEERRRFGFCS